MFEIYQSTEGRKKTYIVSERIVGSAAEQLREYAIKHFKSLADHIEIKVGYIWDGMLYLEDPHKRDKKKVLVAYWVK